LAVAVAAALMDMGFSERMLPTQAERKNTVKPFIVKTEKKFKMVKKDNRKILICSVLALIIPVVFFANFNAAEKIGAQQVPNINIGNNSNISDDAFFQLDDSILNIKNLVNNTKSEIDNGNITGAQSILNQINNELADISASSNNLIWDESGKGA
jgi:hypothetical protein